MVYRFIRQFLNQPHVIQQMADSSLMRTAARVFVSGLYGAKRLAQESTTLRGVTRRAERFSSTFKEEYQKSLSDKNCSTLRDPVMTTCLHPFCRECFNACIDKLKTLRCPICKQRLNKRSCGSCPQLVRSIEHYLWLAKTYTRDSYRTHVPKEAEFYESQVVMTQNVTGALERSPFRHTTNIVDSFKHPAQSRKQTKRALDAESANLFQRPEKRVRCDPSRPHQPATRPAAQSPFKLPLPPQSVPTHSPKDSSRGIQHSLQIPATFSSPSTAIPLVIELHGNVDGLRSHEAPTDGALKEPSLVDRDMRVYRSRQGTTKHLGWKKALLSAESRHNHQHTSNDRRTAEGIIGVCATSSTMRSDDEAADSRQQKIQSDREDEAGTEDPRQAQPQSTGISVQHSAPLVTEVRASSDCSVQVALRAEGCEAMSQTESIPQDTHQASCQTNVECSDIAIQVMSSTVDGSVQTGSELLGRDVQGGTVKKVETKDGGMQTNPLPMASNSEVGDAVARIESMVYRRYVSNPAESRVQSLLACLPWMPTFLGMHYDVFCERCGDEEECAVTDRAQLQPDDEGRSVVEPSEEGTEKVDETVVENNADPHNDENDEAENTVRGEVEGTVVSVTKTEPAAVDAREWESQQTVTITETPSRQGIKLGGGPLAARPSHTPINVVVSSISTESEVAELNAFMDMFPTAKFSQNMTKDCSYLVVYRSEGRLCEDRSLRYVYQIANRGFVVTQDWVTDCIRTRRILSIDDYEVQGDMKVNRTSDAPRRAREGDGGLFRGYTFYLPPPFFKHSQSVTREYMVEIIEMVGGKCVKYPWELSPDHAFIIFAPHCQRFDAATKFESDNGVPVLYANWILDSICEYSVIDNIDVYRVLAGSDTHLQYHEL